MSFLSGDKTKVSAGDWTRIQACWFPIVKSKTITQISEVTEQSICDYLDVNLINQKVKDTETSTPPSYTPIVFN